jgi:mono/diheme cytochrome c family protein
MRIKPRIRLLLLTSFLILGAAAFWATRGLAQNEDPEKLQRGAQLFAENCAVCHGADGQGRVGATLKKDWPSIRPDLTVRSIITNGVPGSAMPAWNLAKGGPLSNEQIDDLVYFILSWQSGGPPQVYDLPTATPLPPITPIPEVDGDPNRGAVLFAENCVVCHGSKGEGRIGAILGKDWAGVRPDLNVQSTISNGIRGSKMPAWSQAKGGPLTDKDIQDLTSYILTLPKVETVTSQPADEGSFKPSWLAGWGGFLLFLLILGLVIIGALYYQKRNPPKPPEKGAG